MEIFRLTEFRFTYNRGAVWAFWGIKHVTSLPPSSGRYVAGFSRRAEKVRFDPETLSFGTKQADVLLASLLAANQMGKLQ